MKKLYFNIQISAKKEIVWDALWLDKNYRAWTSVFNENSHAISDWEEGSPIQFVDANLNGISGVITTKIEYKQMTFTYIAELHEGIAVDIDWKGAQEDYVLEENNEGILLKVTLDGSDGFEEMLSPIFPKALAIVKEIAEGK